jgi:hypothetical protein
MKRKIYMTQHVREATPTGPVMVVQEKGTFAYGNRVDIIHEGKIVASVVRAPRGVRGSAHNVKAFVATDCEVKVS